MKRVLVTGGAGFIGSNLCERLLGLGYEVICLDNFQTGNKKNVEKLLSNSKFELVRHDVVNPYFAEVDKIYHLACPASPPNYIKNPIKTLKTSFIGTLNMLGLAKRVGAKLLLTSTSEVYGDPLEHPQKETYFGNVNPNGVRSCYDEGKRVAESLVMNYHHTHDIEVKIARIFNTYGPNMDPNDGRVVSNFIVKMLNGDVIGIYGGGSQTRSFCYVDDMVEGLIRLMNSDKEVTGPINLGNPNEINIQELSNIIAKIIQVKPKIDWTIPRLGDDPNKRKPDITLAEEILNWEPSWTLEDGLFQTINYFKRMKHERGYI